MNHNLSKKLPVVSLEARNQGKLILQRKIGYRYRMPGSGRWQILDDFSGKDEGCWMCDNHILTVFLFTREVAEKQQHGFDREEIQYYEVSAAAKAARLIRSEGPVISGPFTNWKPRAMQQVLKLCSNLDVKNIINEGLYKKLSRLTTLKPQEEDESPSPLMQKKKKLAESDECKYGQGKWKNFLLQRTGGYKHPVLVNGREIQELEGFDWEKECYVYMDFVKPGKTPWIVTCQDKMYL